VTCKLNGVSGNYCTATVDSMVWFGMVWRLAVGSIERNCCGYRFEVSTVGVCVCVASTLNATTHTRTATVHEVKIPL